MNKYRILTAALSSKATVDDFTFCRSSDLLHFRTSFPFLTETVAMYQDVEWSFTAARTVRDSHPIPFSSASSHQSEVRGTKHGKDSLFG